MKSNNSQIFKFVNPKNKTQVKTFRNIWTLVHIKRTSKMALEGYQILAESLARNGLKYMFGVVGIPGIY